MRRQFILLLFLCLGWNSIGQIGSAIGKDYGNKKSFHKENKPTFSTAALASSITKNANSDTDKVKAIYYWLATNISYDNELRLSAKLQKEFYTSEENVIRKVLDRKMALCGGYAFLFKSLCADVGISAEVIHGFTKDYSGKILKNKTPNHTWNAVKLNGNWHLLDITWAIGHGNSNGPDDFWFMTKPTDFIYTHYPEERQWTLLQKPISFIEFQKAIK